MLTTELTYYGNINIRGTVKDMTAHAQKHDMCDKRIILYQDLSCVGDALWKWDVQGQELDW